MPLGARQPVIYRRSFVDNYEVPMYGLTVMVIRNIHTLLMQSLLQDENALGSFRQKIVSISNTAYVPTQMPLLLVEMLNSIVSKAQHIANRSASW